MSKFNSTCLAFIISIVLCNPAVAQRSVFSENFNSYPQINFNYPWITAGSANDFPWRCDVTYLIFGLGYLDFENNTKVAGTLGNSRNGDALLATPPINLSSLSHAWLSYDSYFLKFQNGGTTESATVEIKIGNDSTWNVLKAAPVSTSRHMRRSYIDLSAYAGIGQIRLGFRYSDSLKPMAGWLIDNIKVFEPAAQDVALIRAYPEDTMKSYYAAPSTIPMSGVVMNTGINPITEFTVAYQEGSGAINAHVVSGVNIAPFDTLRFVHSIHYDLKTVDRHSLKMWVSMVGDTTAANDTMAVILHGAKFIPAKKITIEEGTGTWSLYGPRGHVYLHSFDSSHHPPTRITVHSNDILDQKAYADYLHFMDQTFVPYFIFDRRHPVSPGTFFETYAQQKDYFGFADIHFVAASASGQMALEARITPAVKMAGNYRLALVVTEDGVKGSSSDYAQRNAFANGRYGAMGGFENKPDPIPASDMVYDFVARSINPDAQGQIGCLPLVMEAGQTYTCNLNANYASTWNYNKLSATVLLMRDSDSSILNSKTVLFRSLAVENLTNNDGRMRVHPNPASTSATVNFELPAREFVTVSATDITGRMVMQSTGKWMDKGSHNTELHLNSLGAGVYFISLRAGDRLETQKLSVVQ